MRSELVSLADASDILGVSPERVRQLVVAGDLPAARFGNAWAVPRSALLARRHSARPGGRPLGAKAAWHEIVSGAVDLNRPGRYQRRAHVIRGEMSNADLESLVAREGALRSGVLGAIAYGAALSPGESGDLYLDRQAFEELDSVVAFVPYSLGPVRLRIIDAEAWELIAPGPLAPRAAVALDLLDSDDPRHWVAAEQLVGHE